jgi:hypothetical protein
LTDGTRADSLRAAFSYELNGDAAQRAEVAV